jgi:hypothetical protein
MPRSENAFAKATIAALIVPTGSVGRFGKERRVARHQDDRALGRLQR